LIEGSLWEETLDGSWYAGRNEALLYSEGINRYYDIQSAPKDTCIAKPNYNDEAKQCESKCKVDDGKCIRKQGSSDFDCSEHCIRPTWNVASSAWFRPDYERKIVKSCTAKCGGGIASFEQSCWAWERKFIPIQGCDNLLAAGLCIASYVHDTIQRYEKEVNMENCNKIPGPSDTEYCNLQACEEEQIVWSERILAEGAEVLFT